MKRPTNQANVTIILPVYNAEAYLAESIESVLRQTYPRFKLLIIDDGSTDQSLSICRQFAKTDRRITVKSHKNIGLIQTLNQGLKLVDTEYVARQDADDTWYANKLELQMDYLSKHPNIGMIAGAAEYTDQFGRFDNIDAAQVYHEDIVRTLLIRNFYPHSGIVARHSVLKQCGGYSKAAVHAEDYDLWLRISGVTQLYNLPQPIMRVRLNFDSITGRNQAAQDNMAASLKDRFWAQSRPSVLSSKELRQRTQRIAKLATKPSYYASSLVEDFLTTNLKIAREMHRRGNTLSGFRQIFSIWLSTPQGRRLVHSWLKQRARGEV